MAATTQRVPVGRVEDFRVGEIRTVVVDDREIGIVRLRDGGFAAILNRCPHRGAPICKGLLAGTWPPCDPGTLSYAMAGEVLVCPWHGWEFDVRSGRQLFQPHPARLKLFTVDADDGIVTVTV
jgi:nitrite reductase/ring-hydroxylating ferredoxin subunit